MSAVANWLAGLGRVRRAVVLVLLLWLCTLAATLAPALALGDAIETHLGESLESDAAADGVNYTWMQEFHASAGPLGRTLRPEVIGFGAVMDNTSALADVSERAMPAVLAGLAFLATTWFLTPGIIHRLAADRPIHAQRFLARCGASVGRMFRLAVVSAVVYGALFLSLHVSLFDDLYGVLTRDMTVERTAFFVRLGLYLFFFGVVAAVNLVFDFAKVRMIVEDRRSVLASLSAALRFIADRPGVAVGVYSLNVLLLGIILGVYYVVAPGAGTAGWSMWAGFAIGQAYIAGRLFTKVAFWAGEVSAVQARFNCRGVVRGGSG